MTITTEMTENGPPGQEIVDIEKGENLYFLLRHWTYRLLDMARGGKDDYNLTTSPEGHSLICKKVGDKNYILAEIYDNTHGNRNVRFYSRPITIRNTPGGRHYYLDIEIEPEGNIAGENPPARTVQGSIKMSMGGHSSNSFELGAGLQVYTPARDTPFYWIRESLGSLPNTQPTINGS